MQTGVVREYEVFDNRSDFSDYGFCQRYSR